MQPLSELARVLLTGLELDHFRPYEQLRLAAQPGLTVLTGSNAQGKTALLEALYVLSTARSFRTQSDHELIRWGSDQARVKGEFMTDSGRPRQLELRWQKQGKKTQKEAFSRSRPIKKLADFLGLVPISLFVPDDLNLVQGSPSGRRRYLDLTLSKLYPTYVAILSRYQSALRQRNELLRGHRDPNPAEVDPWNALLAHSAIEIVKRRQQLAEQAQPRLQTIYAHLAGNPEEVSLRYQGCTGLDAQEFQLKLEANLKQDLRRGSTTFGPHRDDLAFTLNGKDIRRFGSQGQQRTLALALRLTEADLLSTIGGEKAIVLLDDCFSELDSGRQTRLLELVADYPQVFITSATLDPNLKAPTMLRVVDGKILVTEN